jgi:hypothetical protein
VDKRYALRPRATQLTHCAAQCVFLAHDVWQATLLTTSHSQLTCLLSFPILFHITYIRMTVLCAGYCISCYALLSTVQLHHFWYHFPPFFSLLSFILPSIKPEFRPAGLPTYTPANTSNFDVNAFQDWFQQQIASDHFEVAVAQVCIYKHRKKKGGRER